MKKLKFTPPDHVLVYIGLQILLHYVFPIKQIISSSLTYLGIILIIFGLYLNWVHVYRAFKKAKTHFDVYKKPNNLVTTGFFKISRNPTYLGMALTILGVAILLGSLITFIFPIIFVILTTYFAILIEEENLEEKFGKEYINYKKKVRRWI